MTLRISEDSPQRQSETVPPRAMCCIGLPTLIHTVVDLTRLTDERHKCSSRVRVMDQHHAIKGEPVIALGLLYSEYANVSGSLIPLWPWNQGQQIILTLAGRCLYCVS